MPIRLEHRQYYGSVWRAFRLELIREAGGEICSRCKATVRGINGAHQNHDPRDRSSVALMCPSCHGRHDARHRLAIWRRRKAEATGQLWLLPEIQWAPFASWEIPAWIHDIFSTLL
jgi:hypothetical protein